TRRAGPSASACSCPIPATRSRRASSAAWSSRSSAGGAHSVVELLALADDGQFDERAAVVVGGRKTDHVAAGIEGLHAIERAHEALAGRFRARLLQGLD